MAGGCKPYAHESHAVSRKRRLARRYAVTLASAMCLPAASAQASPVPLLRSDAQGLTAAQQDASERLLAEAAGRLPPAWRDSLPGDLVLEWRDDLPARVHGRAIGKRLSLRRALLDEPAMTPSTADAAVSTLDPATHTALSALIHELAHVHDRSPKGGLSRDPRLLDLAGWQLRPYGFGLRLRDNPFTDRSPDRYELESPAEFVAVNLEHFLLDPQYACRRPALFRLFAAHFRWQPPMATCAPGQAFLLADADFARAGLESIDPSRIHAVEFLLAEGSDAAMSRWGHSMLRLVVCAPGRTPGPACRLDLAHHRVLSFRAFVGDVQISSWHGLTGSYPSRLFVLPLGQVVDEYTQVELRGLRSIPLRLSRDEVAGLLERAARVHWSYDGRYTFVGNNCAVETWKLLRDGVPRLAGERLRSITPTGLLRRLQRAGIADASVLDDRAEAMRLGYYFEPASARYQAMFEVARDVLHLPQASVGDWLELAPAERAPWLAKVESTATAAQALRAAAALLLLEEAALRREELLARDAVKRQLLAGAAATRKETAGARAELRQAMAREALLTRPAALGGEGYGLPQGEREQLDQRASALAAELASDWAGLHRRARASLPSARQAALRGVEANLAMLGTSLRGLHEAHGGLRLEAAPDAR